MVAITIRRAVLTSAMLGLVVGAAGQARAELVINFDPPGLPPPTLSNQSPPIPDGYQGFNWTNFLYSNASFLSTLNTSIGGVSGVVSQDQAALINSTQPAVIMSTGGTTFDLISASFTSFTSNQFVEVQGFHPGSTTPDFDMTYSIITTQSTPVTFNFTSIDTVKFLRLGTTQFVMDNLSLNVGTSAVPELDSFSTASALTLLTSGVLMLNGRRKR